MRTTKLLSNATSWNNLNQKLEELTKSERAKEAGDIFENVCKFFLQTAPQYQTKLKNVWLLKEVKEDLRRKFNLPSTDEGIDLIAETFDGKYWAIQSKYRSDPKDTLTIKGDLATFANLAFNNCKNISLGLVMTTADKPPLKTKLLKGVSFVTLESFLELDDNKFEGWNLIKAKENAEINKKMSRTAKDFAMLCANCHRMIHRMMTRDGNRVISLDEFKESVNFKFKEKIKEL